MNISSTCKNTHATFFGYILDRTIFINLIMETFSLEFLTYKKKIIKNSRKKGLFKKWFAKMKRKVIT